ncbi:uncharacterized protein (DUF427 family) [Mycetocola sp. CAN_C7]|uniref:DUF427 domain-containing protein n=1 Tax=Mycetocola sp. CAN_C7 TaxID=2787724 RepID=UPI0018CAF5FB
MNPAPRQRRPVPIAAGPGQESVWDYPRPPRVESSPDRITIRLGGEVIAQSSRAVRVLETSHPPVYYVPIDEVAPGVLEPVGGSTWCEFKGEARYFNLAAGRSVVDRGAWHYPSPRGGFENLAGMVAVYPGLMDSCQVGDETVQPQDGDFYGGWVTSRIVGPFKGAPGTMGW